MPQIGSPIDPTFDDGANPVIAADAAKVAGASQIYDAGGKRVGTDAEFAKLAGTRIAAVTWSSVSGGAWQGASSPALAAYEAGTIVSFFAGTNQVVDTVNINGLGPIAIVNSRGKSIRNNSLFVGSAVLGEIEIVSGTPRLRVINLSGADYYHAVVIDTATSTTTAWIGTTAHNRGFVTGGVYAFGAFSNNADVTLTLDGDGVTLPLRSPNGDAIQSQQLLAGSPIVTYCNGTALVVISAVKPTSTQMQAGVDKMLQATPAQIAAEVDRRLGMRTPSLTISAIGSGSTATAWVATASTTLTAYVHGTLVSFAALSNSPAPTIDIDGLGAIPIVDPNGKNLANLALTAGQQFTGQIVGNGVGAKLYVTDLNPAQRYNSVAWSAVGSGSTNTAWVGVSYQSKSSYQSGTVYSAISVSNNGPVTINIDGAGVIPLRTADGDELDNNQLLPGMDILFIVRSSVAYLVSHVKPTTAQMQAGANKLLQATPAQMQAEIIRQIGLLTAPAASDAEAAAGRVSGKSVSPAQMADFTARPLPATVIASGTDGFAGGAGSWAITGGTLSLETSDVRRSGVSVLKAIGTPGAAAVNMYLRKKITASDKLRGRIEAFFKLPKVSAGSVGFYINWSATAPAADPPSGFNANTRNIFLANYERSDGIWTSLAVDPRVNHFGTGSAGTGRAWGSTEALPADIQFIELLVQFSADVPEAERVLLLDQVAINGRDRPIVIIMMDGYYPSHQSIMLPMLAARGFAASTGSATRNTPSSDTTATHLAAKKVYLDALYTAGWDITAQGQRRPSGGAGGYGGDTSMFAADIQSARADLIAAGYTRGLDIMSYPYNSRSPASDVIAAANGIRMARASGNVGLTRSQIGKGAMLSVGCVQTDQRTSAHMIAALDAALLRGEHICYFGHDVVDKAYGALGGIETSKSELAAFVDYLAGKAFEERCEVMTPSRFLERMGA